MKKLSPVSFTLKSILISLVIFGLFYPLFITKQKAFILSGHIQTQVPVKIMLSVKSSEKISGFSSYSYVDVSESGDFTLSVPDNKLYTCSLTLQSKPNSVILSDFVLEGDKKIYLSFDRADLRKINSYQITDNGHSLSLEINQEYAHIDFNDAFLLKAKRIYHITPWIALCFIPIFLMFLKAKQRQHWQNAILFSIPLLLLMLVKYYAFHHDFLISYKDVSWYNIFLLEKYDFPVFAIIYTLILFYLSVNRAWFHWLIAVATGVLFIVLMIDGIVLHNLNARFLFDEATHYKSEYKAAFLMFVSYCGTMQGRLMLLCCFVIGYILRHYKSFVSNYYRGSALAVILLLCGFSVFYRTNFLFDYRFYNVFEANRGENQKVLYSENFKKKLNQSFDLKQTCQKGLNKRKNAIVIIAESLSVFTSRKLSGLNNYMPYLDKLIADYAVYTSYYSNSYNTSSGIYSLLSGMPFVHTSEKSDKDLYKYSLPKRLQKAGYKTYFWTGVEANGPLEEAVLNAGFDEISDYRDPYYEDKIRMAFNAPADEYLFENVLQYIQKNKSKQPHLMVVSTITGHGPYVHPKTHKASFEETTKYVDEEIYKFIKQLEKENYFENGMVLITGDHRAMLPLSLEEENKLAPLAEGRVPLVVIDKDIKGEKSGVYSHNDIAPSLQYYLTEQGCFNDFQNNLFDETKRETCILYQKLSPRDKMVILCSQAQAEVCLNGDKTNYCGNKMSHKYIDFINWLRF